MDPVRRYEQARADRRVFLPSAYAGLRGFGWTGYITPDITLTDSASGDAYALWLKNANAYPYLVGVEWFD
jgi:hypothetical protein